jgi:hypothetical protein
MECRKPELLCFKIATVQPVINTRSMDQAIIASSCYVATCTALSVFCADLNSVQLHLKLKLVKTGGKGLNQLFRIIGALLYLCKVKSEK